MEPRTPQVRVRVLIEDPVLADAPGWLTHTTGMDVRLCSGPTGDRECCPLVADGECPLGPCDVVVCNLDEPWATPVRRAWAETPSLLAQDHKPTDQRSIESSIGTALKAMWQAGQRGVVDNFSDDPDMTGNVPAPPVTGSPMQW